MLVCYCSTVPNYSISHGSLRPRLQNGNEPRQSLCEVQITLLHSPSWQGGGKSGLPHRLVMCSANTGSRGGAAVSIYRYDTGIFSYFFLRGGSKYGTDIRMRLTIRWPSKPSKVSFESGVGMATRHDILEYSSYPK